MIRGMFLLASAAFGATGDSGMLVSTDWLAARLDDRSLAILQVGGEFAAGHIPGARLVQLSDISITGPGGLRLELPPVSDLEQAFARLGVSDGSRVVIYAGTESVQSATRVWFTLDYLGWGDRASLLDGGLALWKKQGRPLSTQASNVSPGKFTARPQPRKIVAAGWVRDHLKDAKVRIVDARTPEFYTGANAGAMPRAGHIPGAHNVPFSSLFTEAGTLKPAAAVRELLAVPAGAGVVTYCHIGQQATVPYFAARYAGIDARLYDGSFQEWSGRSELPVETSAK